MSYYDYRTSAERARNGASFDAQRDHYEGYHSVNQLSDACAETTGVFAAAASRSAGAFGAALGGLIVLVFMLFWRLPFAGKVAFVSLVAIMAGGIYLENRFQRARYNDHLASVKLGAPLLYSTLSQMSAGRIQELSRPVHQDTLQDTHLLRVPIPQHDAFFAVVVGPLFEGHGHWLKTKKAAFFPSGSLDAHALRGKTATPVKIDLRRNICFSVMVSMVAGPPDTTSVDMRGRGAPFYKERFGKMFFLVVCTNPGTSNILIDEDWNGMSDASAFSEMVARRVKL